VTAYCLFDNVEVTDPAAMAEDASKVGEMVRRHGGRYLALGRTVETIEGGPTLHEPVPIEFRDLPRRTRGTTRRSTARCGTAPVRRPDHGGLLRDEPVLDRTRA
jgi:uncharacterized protein (DUF1330 family)